MTVNATIEPMVSQNLTIDAGQTEVAKQLQAVLLAAAR